MRTVKKKGGVCQKCAKCSYTGPILTKTSKCEPNTSVRLV